MSEQFSRGDIVRTRGNTEHDIGMSIDDLLVTSQPDPSGLVMLAARTTDGIFDAGAPYLARADELRLVRRAVSAAPRDDAEREQRDDLSPAESAGLSALVDRMCRELGNDWDREDVQWAAESTLFQLAMIIRRGSSITVPDLGNFHLLSRGGDRQAPRVQFVPHPRLLVGLPTQESAP